MTALLIVDDDEDIRLALAEVLEIGGFEVRLAANGREALAQLREDAVAPALILLDMMMPVMDGWTLMGELGKDARLASIPIVVLSAYRGPSEVPMPITPRAVVPKPVSMDGLLQAVRRALGSVD